MKVGVRQGCLLSPALFNVYVEEVVQEALEHFEGGAQLGGQKVARLQFADDIALLASSEHELQQSTALLDEKSRKYGMIVNADKTKTMVFARPADNTQVNITINGSHLEQVDKFKYLGSSFTENARSKTEIYTRIATANASITRTKMLWKDKSLTIRSKWRLLRTIIYSSFLYGSRPGHSTQNWRRR